MELPDDVVKLIREYSSPSYPYWRAGSYIYKQLKTIKRNLLEELQFWIVLKRFSYSAFNHVRIEYNLLKNCERYRKHVNGEFSNYTLTGYKHPLFGPKIPRPINFAVLIGNTKKLLKDLYHGKRIRGRHNIPVYDPDVEWNIFYQITRHKEMKMRFPDRKFGYNDN